MKQPELVRHCGVQQLGCTSTILGSIHSSWDRVAEVAQTAHECLQTSGCWAIICKPMDFCLYCIETAKYQNTVGSPSRIVICQPLYQSCNCTCSGGRVQTSGLLILSLRISKEHNPTVRGVRT